jgi:hypothetical protein
VVQKAKSFLHIVGLSCEAFDEYLLSLHTVIEASKTQNGPACPSSPISKSWNIRHRELKRLACFVYYDIKGGQSSRGNGKGSGLMCSL